jgi:hypothetical protein
MELEAKVKVFKLFTGEEIVGVLEKVEGDTFYVHRPLAIGINQQEQRLVFVPYMPYTSAVEELPIHATGLLHAPLTPVDSITNDYLEATEQKVKIFIPGKQPILTPVK